MAILDIKKHLIQQWTGYAFRGMLKLVRRGEGGAEYILWFPVGLAWLGLRGGYAKEKSAVFTFPSGP